MFERKINNAELWLKIRKLRELINQTPNFKKRACFECGKDLNIYDFLSDNLEFTAGYVLDMWQNALFEFFCCECFKILKKDEIMLIEKEIKTRYCSNCNIPINIFKFSNEYRHLKISELKEYWLIPDSKIFCSRLCEKKFYSSKDKKKF